MTATGVPSVVVGGERLLRRTMLGSDAVYRVVEEDAGGVVVEVVSAPGLEPGFRMRLTPEVAAEMEAAQPVSAPAPAGRSGRRPSPATD
jgi:hypothetical protein